jgi:glycosyltransferase involved in cell wall biosynthesis
VPRIGFDGRALASPAAGVRRYATELFGALAALDGDLTIVAVGTPDPTGVPEGVERAPGAASLPTNAGWMLSGLPRAARQARLDLFHAPAYTVPLWSPRPLAVTIHDVSYARHPEWYPYRRDPIRRAFYRRSARAADRVITDSAFSKSEIAAAYGIPSEAIAVVPLAAASMFSPGPMLSLPPHVPRRYLLHVGDVHVRRNLAVVVRAMTLARRRDRRLADVGLVLAGVRRDEAEALHTVETTTNGASLLTFVGQTDEDLLLALYRSAAALVYPSRYEGFGLPLLEAMACGVPVVASRSSCIPEVTGEAAVLLDPDDEEGWSAAIARVIDDEAYAAALREAGYRRAASFSWRRTAEETAAVYARLLGA